MRWPVRRKRLDVHVLSQSALATFCSADYSRSACAVFAANLENIDNFTLNEMQIDLSFGILPI